MCCYGVVIVIVVFEQTPKFVYEYANGFCNARIGRV